MKENCCNKKYLRPLLEYTQTEDDQYPQYRFQAHGGFLIKINEIKLENPQVMSYKAVLSRLFNLHFNVKQYNFIKSIKHICKYVNTGSDQAVFTLENERNELKIYISSSEAVQFMKEKFLEGLGESYLARSKKEQALIWVYTNYYYCLLLSASPLNYWKTTSIGILLYKKPYCAILL